MPDARFCSLSLYLSFSAFAILFRVFECLDLLLFIQSMSRFYIPVVVRHVCERKRQKESMRERETKCCKIDWNNLKFKIHVHTFWSPSDLLRVCVAEQTNNHIYYKMKESFSNLMNNQYSVCVCANALVTTTTWYYYR